MTVAVFATVNWNAQDPVIGDPQAEAVDKIHKHNEGAVPIDLTAQSLPRHSAGKPGCAVHQESQPESPLHEA